MATPYKTFSYYTFGCKVNFADSSYIARQLVDIGFSQVPLENFADICLINTCSVTENADKKANKLIKSIHLKYPDTKIVVYGCYAQLKPNYIKNIKGVSAVIGTEKKFDINNILSKEFIYDNYDSAIKNVKRFNISYSINERTRAFIKIQDGCNYNCSFCTIPLARGKSRSLNIKDTVKEIKSIITHGVKEIVLSGINIGDFGYENNETLEDLLNELEKIKKLKRYRISSIEPNLVNENLLQIISSSKKALPHFHIPLQSGSDRILKLMKRRYSKKYYMNLIKNIRCFLPNACIGVDIIVGFPTESESDFNDTYTMVKKMDISYLHVFPYSDRENTIAQKFSQKVKRNVKIDRRNIMRLLSSRKYNNFILNNIGSIREVLFEKYSEGILSGWTNNYIKVSIKGSKDLLNSIRKVQLIELINNSINGILVNEA